MKKITQHIVEALKDSDKGVVDMLRQIGQITSGVQSALYKEKVKDADSVDISPLSEVFSKEEIAEIKKYVRPKPKMCYENAWKLCDRLGYTDHDIKYVEGYINFKGLPIEHAFNVVDGKYVDITIELSLKKDPSEDTYVKIGEYDVDEVRKILLQNGYYGQIYDTIFLNKYKENIKEE